MRISADTRRTLAVQTCRMSQRCESFASEMICRLADKHMTHRFSTRANHARGKTLGEILSSWPGVAFTLNLFGGFGTLCWCCGPSSEKKTQSLHQFEMQMSRSRVSCVSNGLRWCSDFHQLATNQPLTERWTCCSALRLWRTDRPR